MKTIQSRVYTNVILTVIAVFLGIFALSPIVRFTADAQARERFEGERDFGVDTRLSSERNSQQSNRLNDGQAETARATESVASATRELAQATKEMANAQQAIAKAIGKLGEL